MAKTTVPKKSPAKKAHKLNKLGVENSLVNNINARKKAGTSRSKHDHSVSKDSYGKMQNNWK